MQIAMVSVFAGSFFAGAGAAPPRQGSRSAASKAPSGHALRGTAAALDVGTLGTSSRRDNGVNTTAGEQTLQTFTGFYNSHATGRGIWKWQNALEAYEKHWALTSDGHPVRIAEVGVQSGGSMLMWKAAFGSFCHVYGLDINVKCLSFQDASTTITIGDQGDPAMWRGFFSNVCNSLDILVDDGGHEAHQMITTLNSVFPKLNPGGYVAIEDIHGAHYLESFFRPTAGFLAAQAQLLGGRVASIHVYPFLLMVKKAGQSATFPATELSFGGGGVTVDSFEGLRRELGNPSNKGGHVVLDNPAWGSFFTHLDAFFSVFNDLHASSWTSDPPGCASTAQAVCTNTVVNNPMQDLISGYHIYPTKVVVEVPLQPPVIRAVRRGTQWITYK